MRVMTGWFITLADSDFETDVIDADGSYVQQFASVQPFLQNPV